MTRTNLEHSYNTRTSTFDKRKSLSARLHSGDKSRAGLSGTAVTAVYFSGRGGRAGGCLQVIKPVIGVKRTAGARAARGAGADGRVEWGARGAREPLLRPILV